MEEGAPFVLDSDGQTALHQAAAGGHADTVAALILGGCDASVQDFVSLFLLLFVHFFDISLAFLFRFLLLFMSTRAVRLYVLILSIRGMILSSYCLH